MSLALDGVRLRRGGFALDADWQLGEGGRLAVVGPSGGGKSSLLAALAGFLPLAAGRVWWRGARLDDLPPGARPLTMVFQANNLFPHLTVAENVGLGLDPRLRLDAADRARVAAVLARTGIAEQAGQRADTLSGGQESRAALARAVLRGRPLLLLDEPFAALGPGLRAEMIDLVGALQAAEGLTLVMVTHSPEDASRLCPLTVLVADGIAAPPAPTDALFANPPGPLRRYLGR